ncbi:MAG: hypothetical protein MUD01_22210 [Chloroflexaceae bacterium]|nr:hypothetical protein [Chloroflexaceae bacterium]
MKQHHWAPLSSATPSPLRSDVPWLIGLDSHPAVVITWSLRRWHARKTWFAGAMLHLQADMLKFRDFLDMLPLLERMDVHDDTSAIA